MVETYTLKSGIPVLVAENHAAPVVSVQAWVSRGSAHEPDKLAGISHFIEHALFKGTKKRRVGQIALEIESWGGEINAYTSFEETVYYTTLASRYFEKGLDVITDAIQNAKFDKLEMEREKEVILEEIKRAYDSPSKMVFLNLWKTAFSKTPFGRPVLGFEKTVGKMTATTLKQYFTQNYHAGSFALVVAGDVKAKDVLALAEKKFERVRRAPKKKPSKKPFAMGTLGKNPIETLERDVQECQLQFGFRAPAITDAAIPALDILSTALGQGESSRFHQELVKKNKVALDADMGLVATGKCGMATVGLLTTPENLYSALEGTMKILADVAKTGITPDEMERVKTAMESELVYGKQTVEGTARRVGHYFLQFGDCHYETQYLDRIAHTSAEDIQEAFKSLLSSRPVVSMVHPKGMKIDKARILKLTKPPKVNALSASYVVEKAQKEIVSAAPVIWKRNAELPLTSLRFVFLGGGSRDEQTHNLGTANLFSSLWASGTKRFSSLEMAQTLEGIGASVSGFAGKNTCGITADFLTRHWHKVSPILEDVLLSPTFPEDEFQTERGLVLNEISALNDSPAQMCQLNFMKTLFPNTRFQFPTIGTKESVSGLSVDTLKQWYSDYVHKDSLVVSTVGDFVAKDWLAELEPLMGRLKPRGKATLPPMDLKAPSSPQVVSVSKTPLYQTHILIGFLGATLEDKDRYALRLLSSCLAGQGGRLFLELRDKQSLAYTVAPMQNESIERGMFAFYIGSSPEKWDRSVSGIRKEIQKVLDKPISAKELARAKRYLIGRFELDLQRNSSQAMLYALDETYGHGFDHFLHYPGFINNVTAKDVQEVARKFLVPDRAAISIVHPESISSDRVLECWTGKARAKKSPNRPLEASL